MGGDIGLKKEWPFDRWREFRRRLYGLFPARELWGFDDDVTARFKTQCRQYGSDTVLSAGIRRTYAAYYHNSFT